MGRFNTGEGDGLFFDFGVNDDDFEMELDFDVAAPKKKTTEQKTPQKSRELPRVASKGGFDDFDMLFSGAFSEEKSDVAADSVEDDNYPEFNPVIEMPEEEFDEVSMFDVFEEQGETDYLAEIFSPIFESSKGESAEPENVVAEEITVEEPVSEENEAETLGESVVDTNYFTEEYEEPSIFDEYEENDYVPVEDDDFSFNWEEFSAQNDENIIEETEMVDKSAVEVVESVGEYEHDFEGLLVESENVETISVALTFADEFLADDVTGAISSEIKPIPTVEPSRPEKVEEPAEKKNDDVSNPSVRVKASEDKEEKKPAQNKTSKKAKKVAKNIVKEILSWVAVMVVTVAVIFFVNLYVLRPSIVSGHSMDPTLDDGQTIVISKLPYIFGEVERGDIVVIDRQVNRDRTFAVEFTEMLRYNALTQSLFFKDKEDHDLFWIKRVIGVEGDTISFEDGKVYLNGEELKEEYILTDQVNNYPNGKTFTLGKGELFVMGDNRNGSTDSRFLSAPIMADHIVGKMVSG